jgi:hypothetical protein
MHTCRPPHEARPTRRRTRRDHRLWLMCVCDWSLSLPPSLSVCLSLPPSLPPSLSSLSLSLARARAHARPLSLHARACIHKYIYVYTCMYMFVCLCICACVCAYVGKSEDDRTRNQIPGNTFLYRPLGAREFQSETFQSRARGLGDQRLEMVSLCHTKKRNHRYRRGTRRG